MTNEEKRERFQRTAQERKRHVLERLQALGNCSVPSTYAYEAEDLPPIFREIAEKLAEVWHRMSCHSPYSFIPFRLSQKLEVGGICCRWDQLSTMEEVMEYLRDYGANFVALEPIRNQYAERFGNEMCWSYPHCFDNHLGCVILPVREGVLYLPYNSLDSETYERFDLECVRLLTADKTRALMEALLSQAAELYGILADIRRAMPDQADHSSPEHRSPVDEEYPLEEEEVF